MFLVSFLLMRLPYPAIQLSSLISSFLSPPAFASGRLLRCVKLYKNHNI